MAGFRHIQTLFGDTLQRISLRELGDAKHWPKIAALNGLRPPYLTDDPAEVDEGILLTGSVIYLPVQVAGVADENSDPFFTDIQLEGGRIAVSGGDMVLTSGDSNLLQALRHRVSVERKELMFWPDYGCYARTVLGRGASNGSGQLAAFYVRSALLEDPRVKSVEKIEATIVGDQISVVAEVIPVTGKSLSFTKVL